MLLWLTVSGLTSYFFIYQHLASMKVDNLGVPGPTAGPCKTRWNRYGRPVVTSTNTTSCALYWWFGLSYK